MSETEVKSEYEKILDELKGRLNIHAKDYVPKLALALKKEDSQQSGADIVDKIKKDCGYWSRDTIRKHLPAHLKDEVKQEAGKKGAEVTNTKKAIELLAGGGTTGGLPGSLPVSTSAENTSVGEKEANSGTFDKYEDNAKKLFEETLAKRDKQIAELRTELAQRTVQTIQPEEPDEEKLNIQAELDELRSWKAQQSKVENLGSGETRIGLFYPPNDKYPKGSLDWIVLMRALKQLGLDVTVGRDAPIIIGFTIFVENGKITGMGGLKK